MDIQESDALWTARSNNAQTGDIPALWIGETREKSLESCEGCPIMDDCYSQNGTPALAHSSMIRAMRRGKTYKLRDALLNSVRSARYARFGVIGDPGALPHPYLMKAIGAVKAMGMGVLGYTHHWRDKPELAGIFMASCETLEQCDQAIAAGFRAAVILPWDHEGPFITPNGAKGEVCPAKTGQALGRKLTCNSCGRCDGSKPGLVVGFPNHGPKYWRKRRDKIRQAVKGLLPTPHPLDGLDI